MSSGDSVIIRRRFQHSTKDHHDDPMIFDESSICSVNDLDVLENIIVVEDMKHAIEQVNCTKDLGVIVSDDAKCDQHKDNMCKKVRQRSGWVLRTFYSRRMDFMKSIFKSLIQPHIDYCSQLWMPPQGQKLEKIERLLKSWTCRIPSLRNMNYWERLK